MEAANSGPPNTLAGFYGPLRGGGNREKWRGKKKKEKEGRDGRKHPQ